MLRIRLQRTGRSNTPSYRVVVAQKDAAVKGKIVELLGFYLPSRQTPVLEFDQGKVREWVKKGAIPTDTMARIFKKSGIEGMDVFIQRYTKQKSKSAPAEEPAAAPAAEAPHPPKAESADTEEKKA